MSIAAFLLLYQSASSLERVTEKTVSFIREHSPVNVIAETNDEVEKLNFCFTEMLKEIHQKALEANKYAVELGELNKRLSHMAVKDGLTKLYNQTYIKERLDNELKRANQFNHPLSILMLDIDDFKKTNDLHGHLVGDNCLQEISNLIKRNIRDIDIPSRYGGEEFMCLLPGVNSNEATQIAEKIRQSVADYQFKPTKPKQDKTFSLTVSIGIASFFHKSAVRDFDDLIRLADNALYQAKQKGKNQVVVYV
jgi:diguanylate cyclase (GGDEF)-like protein